MESAVPGSPVIFNEADLLRRLAGDRELAQAVIGAFSFDMGGRLSELDRALKERNGALIRRVVHTVKGAAANVSAEAVVAVARSVEAAVERADWNDVVERVGKLRTGVERFREVLRERKWLADPEEKVP